MSGAVQPGRTAPARSAREAPARPAREAPGRAARDRSTSAVVIGVGNSYRRDDGIGPAVAAEIEGQHLPGIRVAFCDGEPAGLLDAWASTGLAVIVDAVRSVPAAPGRIHRCLPGQLGRGSLASSHGIGVPEALSLGRALGQYPRRVVIFGVEAADLGPGEGLSEAVATALPDVVAAVAAELRRAKVPPGSPDDSDGEPGR